MTDPNRTSEAPPQIINLFEALKDSLHQTSEQNRERVQADQTSVGDVPAPIIVEVADTPFNRELRRQMAAEADALRVERWHATYNAALMGMYAFGGGDMSNAEADGQARFAANLAHGELPE